MTVEKPNFTSELSELAEARMREIIETAQELGVEVFSLKDGKDQIIEKVRQHLPERFELVVQRLREHEDAELSDLSKEVLVDRLLGIDMLLKFEERVYAVDVTSAKASAVTNKERKVEQFRHLYEELGIDRALIVRIKEDITEDTVLDLFSRLEHLEDEEDAFVVTIKYPEPIIRTKKMKRVEQRQFREKRKIHN